MKKLFFFFILLTFFSNISNSAENKETFDGAGGREDLSYLNAPNSNFKKGNDSLNQALKLIKKNKIDKANLRLEKALGYFILAYKNTPNDIEILYLLGYTYYLVDDLFMSEIYYTEALNIDPKNILINQKLGELYFKSKRVGLAEDKLNFLANCNCQEYFELKEIIAGKK